MRKVAPTPSFDSTRMLPSCFLMIAYEVARPRPFPFCFVVKYGSKIFGSCSPGMPIPWSFTETLTYLPSFKGGRSLIPRVSFWLDIRITPPSGMALVGFIQRVFLNQLGLAAPPLVDQK